MNDEKKEINIFFNYKVNYYHSSLFTYHYTGEKYSFTIILPEKYIIPGSFIVKDIENNILGMDDKCGNLILNINSINYIYSINYNEGEIKYEQVLLKFPLEIISEEYWKPLRYQELYNFIKKYLDTGKEISIEWIEEYNKYVKNKEKNKL